MPIYEYQCTDCGFVFEVMQRISDPPPSECLKCSSVEVKKIISRVGFQLKGTGWYETDFKNNDKKTKKDSGTEQGGKSDTTSTKDKKTTKEGKESKKAASDSAK